MTNLHDKGNSYFGSACAICTKYKSIPSVGISTSLSILGCGSTSDNLDQFASNDSLSISVVENLELVNHVAGVLGSVVHGVAAGGLFAGMTFGERPVDGVGERVFGHVGEDFVVDFEGGEVCYQNLLVVDILELWSWLT